MVAYSFKPRFLEAIRAGTKEQTIRRARTGRSAHALSGQPVHIFTGSRFKPERVGAAVCIGSGPISLRFGDSPVVSFDLIGFNASAIFKAPVALDAFARTDGFADWPDLAAFWRETHGDIDAFYGTVIFWKDFTCAR